MNRDVRNISPYDHLIGPLFTAIMLSLHDIYKDCRNLNELKAYQHVKINKHFEFLVRMHKGGDFYHKDEHLVRAPGLRVSLVRKGGLPSEVPSRISNLIIGAVINCALEYGYGRERKHYYFPHPLSIALEFLTIPEETGSSDYAFYALRHFIYSDRNCWPEKLQKSAPDGKTLFSFAHVSKSLSNILSHMRRGNDAFDVTESKSNQVIYTILCMEKILQPRINVVGNLKNGHKKLLQYLSESQIVPPNRYRGRHSSAKAEFNVSAQIDRLPRTSEFCNKLWGIPLGMRGADTVFSGGLQLDSKGGLVIGLSGEAGTGKTSVALSICAFLAPLGIKSLFVTAEEDEKDLQDRLESLIPFYFRKTSFADINSSNWFVPQKLPSHSSEISGKEKIRRLIEDLKELKAKVAEEPKITKKLVKPPVPLVIVLDGVHSYFDKTDENETARDYHIQSLIAECKTLNAIVILTSAASDNNLGPIDYLVDLVLKLEYRGKDSVLEKPYRILILEKSRHQISRPGSHLLHLSGKKGVRISPQLTSQIDNRTIFTQQLPKTDIDNGAPYSDVLNNWQNKQDHLRFANVFPSSHMLLHGSGSTGKASLGLKILAAPLLRNEGTKIVFSKNYRPKIYVVSFLYASQYYENLLSEVKTRLKSDYGEYADFVPKWYKGVQPIINVNHCHPGFLKPEDLYVKINDELNRAEKEGEPYTGVLLDGLHNVFMQFPLLESSRIIWPMLYSMFRTRKNLSILTTHTTISIGETSEEEKHTYRLRQDMPFLLALVQSTDFYLELNQHDVEADEDVDLPPQAKEKKERYVLKARSSIGQDVPTLELVWDKRKFSLSRCPNSR